MDESQVRHFEDEVSKIEAQDDFARLNNLDVDGLFDEKKKLLDAITTSKQRGDGFGAFKLEKKLQVVIGLMQGMAHKPKGQPKNNQLQEIISQRGEEITKVVETGIENIVLIAKDTLQKMDMGTLILEKTKNKESLDKLRAAKLAIKDDNQAVLKEFRKLNQQQIIVEENRENISAAIKTRSEAGELDINLDAENIKLKEAA